MSTFITSIAILALIGMVFVYPMYFFSLFTFGKIMARDHSDVVGKNPLSLGDSFKILQSIKAGRIGRIPLSEDAFTAHGKAKRLLYLGASLFLCFLLIGLTDAVLGRHPGLA